jgi:hypothetical protein
LGLVAFEVVCHADAAFTVVLAQGLQGGVVEDREDIRFARPDLGSRRVRDETGRHSWHFGGDYHWEK